MTWYASALIVGLGAMAVQVSLPVDDVMRDLATGIATFAFGTAFGLAIGQRAEARRSTPPSGGRHDGLG